MLYKEIDIKLKNQEQPEAAKLYTYIIDNSDQIDKDRKRPAVIICPGGAYAYTSDREAEPIALKMVGAGYHAFVLRYHVAPVRYPIALLELAETVRLVREHAKEWNIDENKVIISGFSAGGHLAASLAMFWMKEWVAKELNTTNACIEPNGCLLSYPVITSGKFAHKGSFENLLGDRLVEIQDEMSLENQVSEQTPPMFIWHTYTDQSVPVENSLFLISSLKKYNIPVEFHMYPVGGHGLSLATEETRNANGGAIQPECTSWIDLATSWIRNF